METIDISIKGIRNIAIANISIPFENGLYSFVGTNGCGKSTIMLCLSQLISNKRLDTLLDGDTIGCSEVGFSYDGHSAIWKETGPCKWSLSGNDIHFNGMYEGSLFYGTRFRDSSNVETLLKGGLIQNAEIVDADDYVKDQLSFILHGDNTHYRTLKRLKNRKIAQKLGFSNQPYFLDVNGHLISQYRMSSGECLLVSLLHFVYNALERRSLPVDKKILVLIDELELALHPVAVLRLLELLKKIIDEHGNLIIYLSTHSPEIIKTLPPRDIFKVNNDGGNVSLETNCYPSYLIRDLYSSISPDFLLLVEDELAQKYVNRVLIKNNLRNSKLIHTVPVGGWQNVLELHQELFSKKVLGTNTKIISILDGDVQGQLTRKQQSLPHCFLPIQSVEKLVYSVIKEKKNIPLRKILNDQFFIVRSLDEIVSDYNKGTLAGKTDDNKSFYRILQKELNSIGTGIDIFIDGLCDDLENTINSANFVANLSTLIS